MAKFLTFCKQKKDPVGSLLNKIAPSQPNYPVKFINQCQWTIYSVDLCFSKQEERLFLVFADVPCISTTDAGLGTIKKVTYFQCREAMEGESETPKYNQIS